MFQISELHKKFISFCKKSLLFFVMAFCGQASATIIGVSEGRSELWDISGDLGLISPTFLGHGPDAEIIAAPDNVSDSGATNSAQQGFDELQGFEMKPFTPEGFDFEFSGTIQADDGQIPTGQTVNSHMIFLNPTSLADSEMIRQVAYWTFDGEILGVMSDPHGFHEANSTFKVGAPDTTYPHHLLEPLGDVDDTLLSPTRGLEDPITNSLFQDHYTIMGDGDVLRVSMLVFGEDQGDWIRVITAVPVPEPSTFVLMSLGLFGLGFSRRKRLQ